MLQVLSTIEYGRNFDAIDTFTQNHVLHIYDVFSQEYLDKLLTKGTPGYVVSDGFVSAKFQNLEIIGLPLVIEFEAKKFVRCEFSDNFVTNYCFNFMINKKQINRFLCIKLVEWFKLTDFDYTWSGVDRSFNLSSIIHEIDQLGKNSPLSQEARGFIMAPINLEKRFFFESKNDDQRHDNVSVANYGNNLWAWNHALQNIFTNSAVSLITEPVSYQKASMFTEKTLFSVLGCTFPIWIGGYNQASDWAKLGFDIFDDVVNHSYQTRSTLIERCYFALADNLHLLSDRKKLTELREKHRERLLKNRDFLLGNGISKFVDQQIVAMPADLQQVMPEIIKRFRPSNP